MNEQTRFGTNLVFAVGEVRVSLTVYGTSEVIRDIPALMDEIDDIVPLPLFSSWWDFLFESLRNTHEDKFPTENHLCQTIRPSQSDLPGNENSINHETRSLAGLK